MSGKKTSLEGIWRHLMLKENYLELVVPRASDKCSCFCASLENLNSLPAPLWVCCSASAIWEEQGIWHVVGMDLEPFKGFLLVNQFRQFIISNNVIFKQCYNKNLSLCTCPIILFTHLFNKLFNYIPSMCQILLEILKEEWIQSLNEIYILLRGQETEKLILSGLWSKIKSRLVVKECRGMPFK